MSDKTVDERIRSISLLTDWHLHWQWHRPSPFLSRKCTPCVGASQGTAQLTLWAHLPDVPNIVNQWAALVPLTVYLSNMRSNYELAGEVSLRARLSVSMMPKLWELGSIAKLLREKELFLDSVSASGDPLRRTYDHRGWKTVLPPSAQSYLSHTIHMGIKGRLLYREK